jgi:CheY-like chemotaxis protein
MEGIREPHILIVDDTPDSTGFLQICLEKNGISPTIVTNGSDALDELTSCIYDLVFLDWMMPEGTGGQTLKRFDTILNGLDPISDFPLSSARVPVIIYSGTEKTKLNLPSGSHFNILDCWLKEASFSNLFNSTSQIVSRLKTALNEEVPH